MSDLAIMIHTTVAILAVVVMIVRLKLNPVVALVLGSLYLGLATKLGIEKTIEAVTGGFGEIMAEVGLLIAFGVLMGAMLQEMGPSNAWSGRCSASSARSECLMPCR